MGTLGGSPLPDIKPQAPELDIRENAQIGWQVRKAYP